MTIPPTPLTIPSLKRYLFHAYCDLNKVEANLFGSGWDNQLSTLEKAVIMLEDRRFLYHRGIDIRSLVRELIKTITLQKHGGASTIEMQFVRTCTGYREVTIRRKMYELFLAWALLHRASKLEILRSYLKIAYFGTGLRGAYEAAMTCYGIPPEQLTDEQCFQLASMLVYPRPRLPSENWRQKINRRAAYGFRLFTKVGARHLT